MDKATGHKCSSLMQKASSHYQQLLGFAPRRTSLKSLPTDKWLDFCGRYQLNQEAEGIFIPRSLTSYLAEGSENFSLNLFHEYFGHGLFFEYSKRGRHLERLEKRLMREEMRSLKKKEISHEELREFRENNQTFRLIQKMSRENNRAYELFAIWTEYYLSKLTGEGEFDKKYKDMPAEARKSLDDMLRFQEANGTLALLYEIGMPRYCTKERAKQLLEELHGEKAKSADLVIHYGSRKAYSDIDFVIVSPEIKDFTSHWLDIYSFSREQFDYAVSVFDVSVIEPLLKGEFVSGDRDYFESKKRQLLEQPVTNEAVYYNLIRAKQQRIACRQFPEGSKERAKGEAYARTYLKNALCLKRGIRPHEYQISRK